MIIKKSVRCRKCKDFIVIYAEERMPYLGMTLKCDCGHEQKCVKENIHTTKWEDIEEVI